MKCHTSRPDSMLALQLRVHLQQGCSSPPKPQKDLQCTAWFKRASDTPRTLLQCHSVIVIEMAGLCARHSKQPYLA